MSFAEGQTIVHPFHGPLRVTRITERTVRGLARKYFDLAALGHQMNISVPVDSIDEVGLRPLATVQQVDKLLEVLRAPRDTHAPGWARRLKDYQSRVMTGDVEQLCYVVREITRREPKSAASAESQLLRSSSATLAREISLSLQISMDDAHALIAQAAQGSE